MKGCRLLILFLFVVSPMGFTGAQVSLKVIDSVKYPLYPELIDENPELQSPFLFDRREYIIAFTKENKYAIIEVSLNNNSIGDQFYIDSIDFPDLALSGLHSESILASIKSITGRPVDSITEFARPNRLSQAGFMAEDEDIISVLIGDNRIVEGLGLTHPELAKPLFQILNMMDTDLKLDRWNMARHKWENIVYFYYNGVRVYVEAEDTKGGQKSIFNDNIEGGFFIKIWREINKEELEYLKKNYSYLSDIQFEDLLNKISSFNSGEIQPQYILRYGFYEGHTFWRTDPVAISFIFNLLPLKDIDLKLNKKLYTTLTEHFKD